MTQSTHQQWFKSGKRLCLLWVLCTLVSACISSDGNGNGNAGEDPLVDEVAIAYVQRQVPTDEDGNMVFYDAREPYAFMPGAALYIKAQATAGAHAKNITAGLFDDSALYDVKDLSVSADGNKLLFALRAPAIEDADEEDQPTWNIWEYNHESDNLRRVISSNLQAESGQDTAPHYLPDGRIVFSSTRQRDINAIRLDESKPQFSALDESRNVHATVLHVMNADGSNIHQISFNMSHDMAPTLLSDGRIVFSRRDNMNGRDQVNLYTMRPDGTELQLLYGSNSHNPDPGQEPIHFLQAKPLPDGRLLVETAAYALATWGSNWQIIDTDHFIDNTVPVYNGEPGEAQRPLFPFAIPNEAGLSVNGRYLDVSVLAGSNRYLVSWNPCRLRKPGTTPAANESALICSSRNLDNPDAEEASANAGLWIYNAGDNTQRPVTLPSPGRMITEAVAMNDSSLPAFLPDAEQSGSFGYLSIKSVYDVDGIDTTPNGIENFRDPVITDYNTHTARFIRIIKGVGIPDRNTRNFNGSAFGPTGQMRDILGYAPIEPDGSVNIRIPANVPFSLGVLDDQGRRIGPRHNIWLQVRPGQTVQCNGCHDAESTAPHGRLDAEAPSINPGAPVDGEAFANTDDSRLPMYGETMADMRARLLGSRPLLPDLIYQDDWTDDSITSVATPITMQYRNLSEPDQGLQTAIPANEACLDNWDSFCRVTIHYEEHIQPIWDKPRIEFDTDGTTVLSDHTCSGCHDRTDDMGQLQIPPAQLELTDRASEINNRYLISYTELVIQNLDQEIIDGTLRNREEEVPVLDDEGNPVLDENGDPVTEIINFPLPRVMSAAGAAASSRFFDTFNDAGDPVHYQQLSPVELKLISEWLDIGAQYYNDPFEAP